MDTLELIRTRRSIRQYLDGDISSKHLEQILEAASWAPSGLNNQPWRFAIVKDKKIKDKISEFTKYGYIIKDASVLICIFLDAASSYNRDKDIMAIGACIQNLLLMAHSLGIGSCWLGEILNKKDNVRLSLKIEEDNELMAVVAMGYSDEQVTKGCRKNLKQLILKEI